MSNGFVLFGPAHLGAIALAFLLPLGLAAISRERGVVRSIRWIFALLLLGTWALWLVLLIARGWLDESNLIPLHLCDWAAAVTILTLLRPNQRSYELAYFWSLCGTVQALMTPDLVHGFPDPRFVVFFVLHSGVIAAVLYLTFAAGLRPVPASLPRVAAWSLFYLALALTVNALLGTNFGYLSAKPEGPSLLDMLAPWPYYIAQVALIGAGLMALFYAPFFVADRLRASKSS